MRNFFKNKIYWLGIFLVSVVGCGGSSDPEPEPNQPPTIIATEQAVIEGEQASITVTASDSDGSISSYSWTQKSGPNIELSGSDTSTVTFTAPEVTENTLIILTVTATDDDGASASADILVTVNANIREFTMQGKVAGSSVTSANILVQVGELEFSTATDENGDYSVVVSSDDFLDEELVKITATGTGNNNHIKLVSQLGKFEDLDIAAGDDDLLTKDDMFAVNVTNVTTAKYILMLRANDGEQIADNQTLALLSKHYEAEYLLPIATAIKLVVDYSGADASLALPESFSDTLEFISDVDATAQYMEKARANASAAHEEAQVSIFDDSNMLLTGSDYSDFSVADEYFTVPTERYNSSQYFKLNEDNSGNFVYNEFESSLMWNHSSEGLQLEFAGYGLILNKFIHYMDSPPYSVDAEEIAIRQTFKWISTSETHDELIVETDVYHRYPNEEIPDSSITTKFESIILVKSSGIIDAKDILEMQVEYSMPTPDLGVDIITPKVDYWITEVYTAKMVFDGNPEVGGDVLITPIQIEGDGNISELTPVQSSWVIDERGHLIITGETQYDYSFVINEPNSVLKANVIKTTDDTRVVDSGKVLKKIGSELSQQSMAGIYYLGYNFFTPNSYFWIELEADGTGQTVDYSKSLDGSYSLSVAPGLWKINDRNELILRRYAWKYDSGNSSFYCESVVFSPSEDDECTLYHERVWSLYQIVGNGYYVNQTHKFFDDYFRFQYSGELIQGNIFWFTSIRNVIWTKLDSRPIELPENLVQESILQGPQDFNFKNLKHFPK